MKKLIIASLLTLSFFACQKKEDNPTPMAPPVDQPVTPETKDTTKSDPNEGKAKFTLYGTKLPYYFRRIKGNGQWVVDTCRTNTTVFYEEFEPKKMIGKLYWDEYKFQATYYLTAFTGDSISIKGEFEGKTGIATSTKSANASANLSMNTAK